MSTFRCPACDGAGENMTNFDRIMLRMTIEQMAEDRTRSYEEPDRYDDSEITVYCNDAGRWLDWTDAIQAEIEWLKSEVET
jgi:hypothetical protein